MKAPAMGTSARCCLCLDITCGVKALGWYQIIQSAVCLYVMISILLTGLTDILTLIIWFAIYVIAVGPIMMGGFYYYKFLRYPSYDTKKPLPRAHLYNMISIALQFGLFTIFGLAVN